MIEIFKRNVNKAKHIALFGLIITSVLLVTVVYKSDEKIRKRSEIISNANKIEDLETFKKFFFSKINSPFTNLNYEIKKGDTIQKVLKQLKVKNPEIQILINQYKKYPTINQHNPYKALADEELDLDLVAKDLNLFHLKVIHQLFQKG